MKLLSKLRHENFFALILAVSLLSFLPETLRAQSLPNGDWLLQTFDSNICGWLGLSGATLTFDPSQDNTGNGGGSCRVSTDFSKSGLFMVSALNIDCCFCDSDAILQTSNYVSLDFDVKWDNSSTVPLSYFNKHCVRRHFNRSRNCLWGGDYRLSPHTNPQRSNDWLGAYFSAN